MRKILIAILLIIVTSALRSFFLYSNIEFLFDLLSVGAFIYLLAAIIGLVRNASATLRTT